MIDLGQALTVQDRREMAGQRQPLVSEERRRALCHESDARLRSAQPMTLDGEPAKIRGALRPFAAVSRADGRGGDVMFAWITVERIVAKGGNFQS